MLEHEDHFAVPLFAHHGEQIPGGGGVRIRGGDDKDHEVALRNVFLRDGLVIQHDRIRAGRIHEGELAQHLLREIDAFPGVPQSGDTALRAIDQFLDLHGARLGCDAADFFAHERIQKTALARLHFAHDDEQRRRLQIRETRAQNLRSLHVRALFREPQSALQQDAQVLELLL